MRINLRVFSPAVLILSVALGGCGDAPAPAPEPPEPPAAPEPSVTSATPAASEASASEPEARTRRAIFVREPGGEIRRVSPLRVGGEPALFEFAHIHPDGQSVIYCGGGVWPPRIWITDLRSGRSRPISPPNLAAFYPAWSGDGKRIAFSVWKVDQPGHHPWKKVWESNPPGPSHIYVMDADGTGLRQVTEGDGVVDFRPCFSPDSSSVLFVSRRPQQGIWEVSLEVDAEPTLVIADAQRPWFHPNGRSIYFHRGDRLYWSPVGSGKATPVMEDALGISHGAFVTPNGHALLFHSTRGSLKATGKKTMRLWVLPFGKKPRLIKTPGIVGASHATSSRDGTVAFDGSRWVESSS